MIHTDTLAAQPLNTSYAIFMSAIECKLGELLQKFVFKVLGTTKKKTNPHGITHRQISTDTALNVKIISP